MTRTYVLSGIVLYLVFLVATVPVAMLDGISNRFSNGKIRFSETKGTVWQGSATLGIEGKPSGRFSWRVSLDEMLLARLHVAIMEEGEKERTDVVLTPSELELKHVSLTLPASLLCLFDKQLETVKPGGELHVHADDFMLSKSIRGEIIAQWDNASSSLTRVDPLGSYRIHARGNASNIEISLETLNGPLFLKGSGSWSQKGGLKFNGAGESKNEGLSDLLRLAGPALGGGVYALKLGTS